MSTQTTAVESVEARVTLDTAPLTRETITLRVENGRWVAEYSSERVRELMGTAVLPTAFLSSMDGAEVVRVIAERQPGVLVKIGGAS